MYVHFDYIWTHFSSKRKMIFLLFQSIFPLNITFIRCKFIFLLADKYISIQFQSLTEELFFYRKNDITFIQSIIPIGYFIYPLQIHFFASEYIYEWIATFWYDRCENLEVGLSNFWAVHFTTLYAFVTQQKFPNTLLHIRWDTTYFNVNVA
jgi:hypothetical protein